MMISVVTAVFNGEEYLEESIKSILGQTYQNFEYIIVNDGSNDRTKEILNRVKDPRVKILNLEKNGGAANALNIGINEAKGEWIALQDADDISCEHRLDRQMQYINTDSRLVAVGSLIKCISDNEEVDQSTLEWEEFFFNSKEQFRNDQFYSTPICNGTGFFLKKAFKNTGGYDPTFKIAYDYDLWTRMFEEGEIGRVPEVLYKYRINGKSLAHSNKINTTKEVLLSTFKRIAELRFNHLKENTKLILLGSQNDFDFYRKEIEPQNLSLKLSFFELEFKSVKKAYLLYLSNEIDGIVLASNHQIDGFMRFFIEKGLLFGKNLFMVWMP